MNTHDKTIARVLTVVDGTTEEVVEIIEFKVFDLGSFAQQLDVPVQYDPDMLDRYAVGPDDVAFVQQHLASEVAFDFSAYGYFIEAYNRDS
jgi:hypothetical protein